MATGHTRNTIEQLEQLASDVVRLCHGRQAVLTCGSVIVAQWEGEPGPRFVIAVQPFGVAANAYELKLLDDAPRELTAEEVGSFQALTEAFRRHLTFLEPASTSAGHVWVKDHVAVAVDYVTDSFILLFRDWTIQHVNSQFERMVDQPRTSIVGRNLWEAFPQIVGTAFEEQMRAAMAGTVPRVFEERSEQSNRWYQSRAFPCQDGLAILTIDITDRKNDELARAEMERKTLQSQRMESLGTLSGGIAHDFNNILGAILGHVGLLVEKIPRESPARESVEQIGIAGRRARDLVQQILAFARATTREFVHQPIRPLIEEGLQLLRSILPVSVELEIALSEEPLATTLNSMEVQQLLMNLGTNAAHSLQSRPGRITIQLGRVSIATSLKSNVGQLLPGDYAEIVVSDTGVGMNPETMERLFEPFFTTKRRGQGTGLGLHVVNGIVTAHGGAIVVKSEPGGGSAFHIYVPGTILEHAETAPVPTGLGMPMRGERVAYVDDDEVVRLMVQRVLERQGFDVTVFADPDQLVEAAQAHPEFFDLLVTDYSMPGRNGLEVARAVRRVRPDIPIIIATGYVPDGLRAEVERMGNAEILNKEHTFEELGERASRAVSGFPASKLWNPGTDWKFTP
jgi:signal transduction histidine kinase/CheY-like chemotaxis protein